MIPSYSKFIFKKKSLKLTIANVKGTNEINNFHIGNIQHLLIKMLALPLVETYNIFRLIFLGNETFQAQNVHFFWY